MGVLLGSERVGGTDTSVDEERLEDVREAKEVVVELVELVVDEVVLVGVVLVDEVVVLEALVLVLSSAFNVVAMKE